MNRRELLQRGLVSAAAVAIVAPGEATPDVEPVPTQWNIERVFTTECDLAVTSVSHALSVLGWESGAAPAPLLCVSPERYAYACEVAAAFGGVVHATSAIVWGDTGQYGNDIDAWCVAWRGRRVGSIGA